MRHVFRGHTQKISMEIGTFSPSDGQITPMDPSHGQISTNGIYLTMDMLNIHEISIILFAISHGTPACYYPSLSTRSLLLLAIR